MSTAPTFDLAALRAADPELAELMLEACDSRRALANALVLGIGSLAAERALAAERDRIDAHLTLGEPGGMRGARIAATAIRAGVGLEQRLLEHYRQAALEVRAPAKLRLIMQEGTENAGTDHAS